jgi:glycosyltransferase involved in cell wall biosynthesis
VLLAVRRLVRRMGLEVLLEAFARVHRARPDARLLIGGTGPLEAELRAQAERLGLSGAVGFLGRLDDAALVRHYQASDLTVVPTVALEGFGLITVESLASGTPVVGTREGGTAEILMPFSPQLVVAPGDAPALASAVLGALDGRLAVPDPAGCRRYALERYGWGGVLDRLERVLAGV